MLVDQNNRPLNFGEYKTKQKKLEQERVELLGALSATTDNLAEAVRIIGILKKELLLYVDMPRLEELVGQK